MGLGGYPNVSLTAARRIAEANRVAVTGRMNPSGDSKPSVAAYIPTFREAAYKVHAQKLRTWKNPKHAASWIQILEKHAFPIIGDVPIDEVTRADVLSVLEPIWTVIPENALSLRAKRDELGCVPHGFRSSFRDFCAEQTNASWTTVELSLVHTVGTSLEQAYFRSDLIDQSRELLQSWSNPRCRTLAVLIVGTRGLRGFQALPSD